MKSTVSLIVIQCIILISSGLAINPVSAAEKSQYTTKTFLLSFESNYMDRLELEPSVTKIANKVYKLPIVLKKMILGAHRIEQDANGSLLWNGQTTPPTDTPFIRIAAPEIGTSEGEYAKISQATSIEYFVEESNGGYSLKTTPSNESPGISVGISVRSQGDDQVEVNFDILTTVMYDRQKLLSTELDVGKPILKSSKQTARECIFKLGEWYIPALFGIGEDASGKEYLVVLMMINRI